MLEQHLTPKEIATKLKFKVEWVRRTFANVDGVVIRHGGGMKRPRKDIRVPVSVFNDWYERHQTTRHQKRSRATASSRSF